MDVNAALAARRSVRDYSDRLIPPPLLEDVLGAATMAPSAGFSQALDVIVLDTPETVAGYWDVTLPQGPRRDRFGWPGLLAAPVLAVWVTDPQAYVRRYSEEDKAPRGLGTGADAWPVPYWWVDAGASIMAVLSAATAAGLGSLLFGLFDHEAAVATHLGVPPGRRLVGVVALGYAADAAPKPGRSAGRPRRGPDDVVHRHRW